MTSPDDALIVGFDLGHGETAIATTYAARSASPTVLRLPGSSRRQHVTAVAEHPQRGVLIGEHAAAARDVSAFYLAFKSPDIDDESVRRPVALFVGRLVEALRESGDIAYDGDVRWVFGAPSGWSRELRARYELMLASFGLAGVEVIPESRGALLYARDAGEVEVEPDRLAAGVLIVDIGSSTTDYTSVVSLRATPLDDGNPYLGAALIDREILRRVLAAHPERARLEELVHDSPADRRRLELICRRSKEEYYSTPAEHFVADPGLRVGTIGSVPTRDGELLFDARVSKADMDAVVGAPLAALDGRSWSEAFRADIAAAIDRLGRRPGVVLLTGGPSRMGFVVDVCRDVAPDGTLVLRGQEPEFAIARGLALAGRMAHRARGFRRDVRRLIDSQKVETLVGERLAGLVERLGAELADDLTERHLIPVFLRWRAGELRTLDDATAQIAAELQAEFEAHGVRRLQGAFAQWQNELIPELEELTRPICLKRGLDPKAMKLPQVEIRGGELDLRVQTTVGSDVLDNLADAISLVVAGVIATTLFGAGAAIIASTGPFAVVIAFFVALGVLGGAKDEIVRQAMAWEIPASARRLRGEAWFARKLRERAPEQEAKVAAQFAGELMDRRAELASAVTAGIEQDLELLAAEAEYLIA